MTVGGVELMTLPLDVLRTEVALVTQEHHVFVGSVADNVRLGRPGASDETIREAIEAIGADSWVDGLPEGMDTMVGSGHLELSPAQAQEVALARLQLTQPEASARLAAVTLLGHSADPETQALLIPAVFAADALDVAAAQPLWDAASTGDTVTIPATLTQPEMTQEQLQNVLQLLQNGQLSIPQPQQRQPTLRPLLPAEHNTLNQQVSRLAAATGEPGKLIWQSMLELCGVKTGELIPATHFTPLSYWLQARQTLSAQSAPTLTSLQAALKQPLEAQEWQKIVDFAQHNWHVTPQTALSATQILTLLNKVFVLRVARAQETLAIPALPPEPSSLVGRLKKPGVIVLVLILLIALLSRLTLAGCRTGRNCGPCSTSLVSPTIQRLHKIPWLTKPRVLWVQRTKRLTVWWFTQVLMQRV